MTEFKPGDKVTHASHGAGEVKYGPYRHALFPTAYLVEFPDGAHRTMRADVLTPRPAFQEGSMALWCGREVSVMSDRLTDDSGVAHHVVKLDGRYGFASESSLSPLPSPSPLKVGDKIRILEDGHGWADVKSGDVLTVNDIFPETFHTDAPRVPGREWWLFLLSDEGTGWERVADADTETINGVTYVMGARYRDSTGDLVRSGRASTGVARATYSLDKTDPASFLFTLADVVDTWGPLTRVED